MVATFAFASLARNLGGNDSVSVDVFVRDMQLNVTTLVSVDQSGGPADNHSDFPAISGNGRYVAFSSVASDLITGDGNGAADVFVRDLQTGSTARVSVDGAGGDANAESDMPAIGADSRLVPRSPLERAISSPGTGTAPPTYSSVISRRPRNESA